MTDPEGQQYDSEQKGQIKKLLKKVDAKLSLTPSNQALLNAKEALENAYRANNHQERIRHLKDYESNWNRYKKYS